MLSQFPGGSPPPPTLGLNIDRCINRRLKENWLQVSNLSLERKPVLKNFITLSKDCHNLHEQLSTSAPVDNNQVSDHYQHPKHNRYPANLTKNKLLLHLFSGTADKVRSCFSGQNVLKWNVGAIFLFKPFHTRNERVEPPHNGRCRDWGLSKSQQMDCLLGQKKWLL